MLLCLVVLLQLLQLIASHEAPTVKFRSRKQLIYEGEAIEICVYVRDGPFSQLTLAMELYDLSDFDSSPTLFEVNITSTELCFTLNEDLISRVPYNAYVLEMPFDYFDNTSDYHVGFPFFLKLFVTGLPPPPCPCEERLAQIACKVLETKGEERLPTPCIKALYPRCFKRKDRKRCGRRRGGGGGGGGCGGGPCGGDPLLGGCGGGLCGGDDLLE